MDEGPALIYHLCSKPIRAGTGTTQARQPVVHVRCLARETRLRALDLREQSAELRVERMAAMIAARPRVSPQSATTHRQVVPDTRMVPAVLSSTDHVRSC